MRVGHIVPALSGDINYKTRLSEMIEGKVATDHRLVSNMDTHLITNRILFDDLSYLDIYASLYNGRVQQHTVYCGPDGTVLYSDVQTPGTDG